MSNMDIIRDIRDMFICIVWYICNTITKNNPSANYELHWDFSRFPKSESLTND